MISVAWPDGRDQTTGGDAPRAQKMAATQAAPVQVVNVSQFADGQAFDHNGSMVRVYPAEGLIAYDEPKSSLRDVAKQGTVIFRGKRFLEGGRIEGTAFAFKKGCPPAPYAVRGGYSRDDATVTLRGAGPVREGCDVVGYSERSPHAVLRFKSMMSP